MTASWATGRSPRVSGRPSCGPAATGAPALITGVSDAQFELLRWYFVEVDDDTGFDAAADVIARAVDGMAPGTQGAAPAPPAIEARDLLADLDAVLGQEKARVADLPALLRDLAPGWTPYRTLTGVQLYGQLMDAEVRVTKTGNVLRLDPADLRRVLAAQDEG